MYDRPLTKERRKFLNAQRLRINRHLKTACKRYGIPLHKVRTRRNRYTGTKMPSDLWNEETGQIVKADINVGYYAENTILETRLNRYTLSTGAVIVELAKMYGVKLPSIKHPPEDSLHGRSHKSS